MKEGYKALGEFIRQIDIRNTEGKEDNLLGVSVQKQFIPSIANTVGTDFTKYKVVKKGQFTYIPDTSRRGDKIAIALLQDYEEGLVSNVYREAEKGSHYYRQRVCAVCGSTYWPTHSQQKFCSEECKKVNHNKKTLEFYYKKQKEKELCKDLLQTKEQVSDTNSSEITIIPA